MAGPISLGFFCVICGSTRTSELNPGQGRGGESCDIPYNDYHHAEYTTEGTSFQGQR